MYPVTAVRAFGNVDHGLSIVTFTVTGSIASTAVIDLSTAPDSAERLVNSRFVTTAAASNGSPSWNEMPGRVRMVHSVKSGFAVMASARYGATVPSTRRAAKGS